MMLPQWKQPKKRMAANIYFAHYARDDLLLSNRIAEFGIHFQGERGAVLILKRL